MYEPVTDVFLPEGLFTVRAHQRATFPHARGVVVILQAYGAASGQQSIEQLCTTLVRDGGIQLLVVEGAKGPLASPSRLTSVATAMASTEISAGVIAAHSRLGSAVHVEGVDEPELVALGHRAMRHLQDAKDRTKRIFREVASLLDRCQVRHYPSELAAFQRTNLSLFPESDFAVAKRVAIAGPALRAAGVATHGFPNLTGLGRLIRTESASMFGNAERGREIFARRVIEGIISPWQALGQHKPDALQRIGPLLQYWAAESGYAQAEFDERVSADLSGLLGECREWYERQLFQAGLAEQQQQPRVIERWMRMALSVGIPYFDLVDFRRYIAYVRDSASIDLEHLIDEFWDAAGAAAAVGGVESLQLYELEDFIDRTYLALRLSLVPMRAEPSEMVIDRVEEALARLSQLSGVSLRLSAQDHSDLAGDLAAAQTFYATSLERSGLLVQRMFDTMDRMQQEKAILVTGGFHSDVIRRRFEEEADLSWSICLPKMDLDADRVQSFTV